MLSNIFKTKQSQDDFVERMDVLLKLFQNKKVIFYGIGEELSVYLHQYNFKKLNNIIAISDTSINDLTEFEKFPVIPAESIKYKEYDYILIAQDNLGRAEKYLMSELHIPAIKIINLTRTELPDVQVNLKYLKNIKFEKRFKYLVKKLRNKKVVIFGANSFAAAISQYSDLKKINIIGFCDFKFKMNDCQDKFCEYQTYATHDIEKLQPDYIIVAEKYHYYEIAELLAFTCLKNTNTKIIPFHRKILLSEVYNTLNMRYIATNKQISCKTRCLRIANILTNRFYDKFLYNTYTPYNMPTSIRLDACTLCQLKCPSCYMRKYEHSAIGDGWLKFKDFKQVIDTTPYLREVSLSNSGEIFLNPELFDIVKYAYEKKVRLNAMTGVNLNTLSDEMAEALVKYKFEYMILSIDGASQETYAQYRVNGNFNKVINNIKKINFYKEKYKSDLPHMNWKFILFNHNEHEIVKAKEMAKDLNIEICFSLPWGDNTFISKNPEYVKRETGLAFASVKEGQSKTKTKRALGLCARTFSSPQFNYDGNLLACCILYNEHYGMNLFENGLEKVLNSAEFQYTVRMIRGELHPNDDIPCTKCNEYDSISYNESYFS